MMTTRFSVELTLDNDERLRLFQVFQYLVEAGEGRGLIASELAAYLAGPNVGTRAPERIFAERIGTETTGFDIIAQGNNGVRIFDTGGEPNLRMLCKIIATVVPTILPIEFTFALVDEVKQAFSGGLVVITDTSAEIQTIGSALARRGNRRLQ